MEMMSLSQGYIYPERIALFGSAFDPLTNAHKLICDTIYERFGWDVWAMPCWGHKFGKKPTEAATRLEMLEHLSHYMGNYFIPFDWEIKNQHSGSMYETLSALKKLHPNKIFHVVIGMDNANRIEEWDRWESLIAENPFIVIGRKGYSPESDWFLKEPHVFIPLETSTSSTDFRSAVAEKRYDDARKMVHPSIWEDTQGYRLCGFE
jgi:nicotinate-nucleotide adenylyltransferase